jgi:hypothetical protein
MYCPGICHESAWVKVVTFIKSTHHGDNVAISVFRSHVLYLDWIKDRQLSTFKRQLRPLSSSLGRAAIRRLPAAESSLGKAVTCKPTCAEAQSFSSSLASTCFFSVLSWRLSTACLQTSCRKLSSKAHLSRANQPQLSSPLESLGMHSLFFLTSSSTHFHDETHTTFAVFTLAVA